MTHFTACCKKRRGECKTLGTSMSSVFSNKVNDLKGWKPRNITIREKIDQKLSGIFYRISSDREPIFTFSGFKQMYTSGGKPVDYHFACFICSCY